MFHLYQKALEKPKLRYWIKEWIEPILIALILALFIKTFFIQAFKIPTGSMRNTLIEHDRILVNKLIYRIRDPKRGDVVVFRYPGISFFRQEDFIDKDIFLLIDKIKTIISNKEYPYSLRDFNLSLAGLNSFFYSIAPFEILKYELKNNIKNREAIKLIREFEKKYKKEFKSFTDEELKIISENSYGKRLKRLILEEAFLGICPVSNYKKEHKRDFIKRLIGEPGDIVEIREGNIYINGKIVTKPNIIRDNYYYNKESWHYAKTFQQIKVPHGAYFALGDNSANSSDSRNWGFIERKDFLGKAIFIYWPLKRWRKIN